MRFHVHKHVSCSAIFTCNIFFVFSVLLTKLGSDSTDTDYDLIVWICKDLEYVSMTRHEA